MIGFTCKVCNHRQHKTMSKLAYTKGVVIIRCDSCKNNHLIADNLGWFRDGKVNIEDLMRENNEVVQR
ncbi:zf-DNL-domain-containing protein, partial [Ramicandelaber brevisporus]